MTTIAYKNGVMAADTLVSDGNARAAFVDKIGKVPLDTATHFRGAVYGTTGSVRDFVLVKRWADEHGLAEEFAPAIAENTAILMVSTDRQAWHIDGKAPWVPIRMIDGCSVLGSGGPEAMGAMLAGATALEAVTIAARLDAHTQGPFQSIGLDPSPSEEELARRALLVEAVFLGNMTDRMKMPYGLPDEIAKRFWGMGRTPKNMHRLNQLLMGNPEADSSTAAAMSWKIFSLWVDEEASRPDAVIVTNHDRPCKVIVTPRIQETD